jgi:hypothetical protein
MTSFIPKFCNDFACVEALATFGISMIPKESNKTVSFLYIKIPFLEVNFRTREGLDANYPQLKMI